MRDDPVDLTWHFAHVRTMFGNILAIVSGGGAIAVVGHSPSLGALTMEPGG